MHGPNGNAATLRVDLRSQHDSMMPMLPSTVGFRAACLAVLIGLCAGSHSNGVEYHVAPSGDDAAAGTAAAPWRTLTHAAERAEAGDTVLVAAGVYAGPVRPARSGEEGRPIRFVASKDGRVEVSGARALTGWTRHEGNVWAAPISGKIDQVFVDRAIMTEARTPNSSGDPWRKNVLELERTADVITGAGLDQPEGHWVGATLWGLDARKQWVAQTTTVVASKPGELTVADKKAWWSAGKGFAILIGPLTLLDAPGEWAVQDEKLHLRLPGDGKPDDHLIEVVEQGFAFDLAERSHIEIEGFALRCASINFDKASHCIADGITAEYVSLQRNLKGGFNRDRGIEPGSEGLGIVLGGEHNILRNSHIAYGDGDGVSIFGKNNTVENCLIHDFDYSASDCAPVTMTGEGHVITRCTIYNGGRSILVHRKLTGGRITHNHLFNAGLICRDLGMTYTYQTDGKGTEIAWNRIHHNWAVRAGCVGIYLDDDSTGHRVHHNVVFQVNEAIAMNPPGSRRNLIINNTLLAFANSISMSTSRPQDMTGTIIRNNIFRGGVTPLAAMPNVTIDTNLERETDPKFVDAAQFDFRLSEGSPAIDAGVPVPDITAQVTGSAPDLGAHEFGVEPWETGCNLPAAREVKYPTEDLAPYRKSGWHPLNVVNRPPEPASPASAGADMP